MATSVIVLAAGQGTRMRSRHPKVLQPLAGRPMLAHVIASVRELDPEQICVVYGYGGDRVRKAFAGAPVDWVLQAEQLGTGHAVRQAMPEVTAGSTVLIVCGDTPLLRAESLRPLIEAGNRGNLAMLTVELDDPTGYGRVLRNPDGELTGIAEEKDATPAQRRIREVNIGVFALPAGKLGRWLGRLEANNAQQEYYLTDIIRFAVADRERVHVVPATDADEVMGINDRRQLAEAETVLRRRHAEQLLDAGVTLSDPARVDVRGDLECGKDVHIDVNVIFEGHVKLGDDVRIGPNTTIRDTTIGQGSAVLANCVIESADIGSHCEVGPFARLRRGTELAEQAKVGNYVEVKNSRIGKGSKVNHLTYIGDADIGANVNVGAGTITCNYDGANKHKTVIGDGAFIGSGVMLVAPVEVGAGATIGAGSTISKAAPAGELSLERSRQNVVKGWKRPVKRKD